ncbi:MAG: hypothetical protein Q7S00_07255 [bacterium]|nr:hypothetical protein [bacterium]
MSNSCDITRQRFEHLSNLSEEERKKRGKRPPLLKRKITIPELKNKAVRLFISEEGLKQLKETGGLAPFLQNHKANQLSPRLRKLKVYFPDAEPKTEEKPAEKAPPPAEAPVEAPPSS